MIIRICNRSGSLPRKRRRKQHNTTQPKAVYRADDHRELPSVLERRCSTGRWQSTDDDAATMILNEIIRGEGTTCPS